MRRREQERELKISFNIELGKISLLLEKPRNDRSLGCCARAGTECGREGRAMVKISQSSP